MSSIQPAEGGAVGSYRLARALQKPDQHLSELGLLGGETLLDVLSNQRARIMAAIRGQVNAEMRGFGVDVADVRIRRADLPRSWTPLPALGFLRGQFL